MKKNEYEKQKAFLEWMKELEPEELPERMEKKIHKAVMKKIRAGKQKEKKHLKVRKWVIAAASVIVVVGAVPMTIYAASNRHMFEVFVNDKRMEEYADTERIIGIPLAEGEQLDIPEIVIDSQIVDKNSFDDFMYFSKLSDVVIEEEIPSMVMGMNTMVIFTTSETNGWYLKKGDTLEVKYNIDGTYNYGDGTGEVMIFGYIFNKQYHEVSNDKATEFCFNFEATEDGIYYPTIQNAAIGYVKITDGQVKVK